jgi:hypothetical protein
MKSFKDYLVETELMEESPTVGDIFEIEIAREELVLESQVVELVEDGIVIEADDTMMRILMHVGYLTEDSNMPTAQDSISPIHGKTNGEHSSDDDLEEQQGMSQRAQDAFKDLDATVTGSTPAQAQDTELEKFRQRAQQGQASKPTKLQDMNPLDRQQWEREKQQHGIKNEAKYQGREVPLGKPMAGDVKKSKVYVRDPKTGNVKKVNFGDPNMKIKKSNPARRKSFRARHNCANPGPRTKARYWSCRAW